MCGADHRGTEKGEGSDSREEWMLTKSCTLFEQVQKGTLSRDVVHIMHTAEICVALTTEAVSKGKEVAAEEVQRVKMCMMLGALILRGACVVVTTEAGEGRDAAAVEHLLRSACRNQWESVQVWAYICTSVRLQARVHGNAFAVC